MFHEEVTGPCTRKTYEVPPLLFSLNERERKEGERETSRERRAEHTGEYRSFYFETLRGKQSPSWQVVSLTVVSRRVLVGADQSLQQQTKPKPADFKKLNYYYNSKNKYMLKNPFKSL